MNSKILKKKLKKKYVEASITPPFIIYTQTNLIKSKNENKFLKEILINNFLSFKVSSRYIKSFLNNDSSLLKSLSSNNFTIYVAKAQVNVNNIKNLLELFFQKKFNIILGINFFNNFLTLKDYYFFFNINLFTDNLLYRFLYKMIDFSILFKIEGE